jgi:hypothetical protein
VKKNVVSMIAVSLLFSGAAQAADTVNFNMKAHMPSLNDAAANDILPLGFLKSRSKPTLM